MVQAKIDEHSDQKHDDPTDHEIQKELNDNFNDAVASNMSLKMQKIVKSKFNLIHQKRLDKLKDIDSFAGKNK